MYRRILLGTIFSLACIARQITSLPVGLGADGKSDAKGTQQEPSKKLPAADQEYELKYKFGPQETIRWTVTHLATTETTIQGNTQESRSSSVSTKAWRVQSLDGQGNITFVHSVENVNMWQSVDGREEIRYNSESGEAAPSEYETVAATIGKPLSTVTISPSGKVINRTGEGKSNFFGTGEITLPLPEGRVKIGHQWNVPSELTVRADRDGRVQKIKTRQLFTLVSVKFGLATITVKTEVLTPVTDPKIQSQIVQQMTSGTIQFDLDAGRMKSKQIDWNENIVGFNGPASNMKYMARFTEELLPVTPSTARKN